MDYGRRSDIGDGEMVVDTETKPKKVFAFIKTHAYGKFLWRGKKS